MQLSNVWLDPQDNGAAEDRKGLTPAPLRIVKRENILPSKFALARLQPTSTSPRTCFPQRTSSLAHLQSPQHIDSNAGGSSLIIAKHRQACVTNETCHNNIAFRDDTQVNFFQSPTPAATVTLKDNTPIQFTEDKTLAPTRAVITEMSNHTETQDSKSKPNSKLKVPPMVILCPKPFVSRSEQRALSLLQPKWTKLSNELAAGQPNLPLMNNEQHITENHPGIQRSFSVRQTISRAIGHGRNKSLSGLPMLRSATNSVPVGATENRDIASGVQPGHLMLLASQPEPDNQQPESSGEQNDSPAQLSRPLGQERDDAREQHTDNLTGPEHTLFEIGSLLGFAEEPIINHELIKRIKREIESIESRLFPNLVNFPNLESPGPTLQTSEDWTITSRDYNYLRNAYSELKTRRSAQPTLPQETTAWTNRTHTLKPKAQTEILKQLVELGIRRSLDPTELQATRPAELRGSTSRIVSGNMSEQQPSEILATTTTARENGSGLDQHSTQREESNTGSPRLPRHRPRSSSQRIRISASLPPRRSTAFNTFMLQNMSPQRRHRISDLMITAIANERDLSLESAIDLTRSFHAAGGTAQESEVM
ncbi:hypothetical protein MMC12_001620 [Toensbergia leucococca]|nr:hypothetical protein [Toensbergia leucococca]